MRICYECGKEIENQHELVLKEFRVAEWGVKLVKPFHVECLRKRAKVSRRKYIIACFVALLPLCFAVSYWVLTLL
ncbi:MAG: hypothetical protein ACQXXH_08135 [Candidatus Bathyarchaeia archaeon]|jgi:hypothetical protein|nr:hypothetical protein [Candidatus Bathyarchaeota archaeon A05DMB-4]MDH7595107.1 hypothetical protein [Candidatus Bathyarchaeota archaeon]